MGVLRSIQKFLGVRRNDSDLRRANPNTNLSFDGINAVMARQLSELESQIGDLAQIQFEMGQERERMRVEMEQLRNAIASPGPVPADEPVRPVQNASVDELPH